MEKLLSKQLMFLWLRNSSNKNIINIIISSLVVMLVLCFSLGSVFAQNENKVFGTVTDQNGQSLIGVTVKVKGTSKGVATNAEGKYSITIPSPSTTLVFTYVGFAIQEVPVNNRGVVNVRLNEDNKALNEVVVIGYGSVKKSDVTGSLVSLKASELTPGANVNVQQLIQGRASGVQIYQKSGEPGSAMSVKIRGVSSISAGNNPLYVIDGMPVNDEPPVSGNGAQFVNNPNPRNPLNSLNPSDIESIEILKDASATAIYGSRGANGVVLITTKKGATGKLSVGYNGYYGTQKVANNITMLNAQQYHDVLNSIIDAGGGGINPLRVSDNITSNTDWQAALYQTAATQSHDLSFSGGANATKYYVSFGYFDQDGIVNNSAVKRYTGRLNLDNSVSQKYGFGVTLNTSYIKDFYNSSGLGVNDNGSALYTAMNYDPTGPIYNPDGSYNDPTSLGLDNPLAMINGQTANSDSYRTFGSAYGEYFLVPSLSAKVRIGGDINTSQRNVWIAPFTKVGAQTNGVASILTGNSNYYMGEATLNFNRSFGKHAINSVAGSTYERFGFSGFSGNSSRYVLPDLTYNGIGNGDPLLNQINSNNRESRLVSFLGRVNYSFNNKYLFTASMRADGSSKFASNNLFGYFPSAAIAWKLQEEPFIKKMSAINELKLRASYGATGNQAIRDFLFLPTFGFTSRDAVFTTSRYPAIIPSRDANPDLKWESAIQADLGLDFAFYNSRFKGSIEYYNRKTSDLLIALPQPLNTGFATSTQNIGSMRNTGFDFSLSAAILKTKAFGWDVNANLSTIKNKVLALAPGLPRIIQGGAGFVAGASIIIPGESIASYYGYEIAGTWQTNDDFTATKDIVKPGDVKYVDQNGDRTITDADRVILGKPTPDFTFGLTNTFNYKKLALTFYVEGSEGGSILNNSSIDSYFPIEFRRNKVAEPYLNRWTSQNPTNEYPSFVNPTAQGQRLVNSRTVEDASYIRLQSARLSYNIPVKANKFVQNVNVYLTGQNLFTITNYSGVDPALNSVGDDILKIDYSAYPFARTYLMGINVQF